MKQLIRSLLFLALANALVLLDVLAYTTGSLQGSVLYLLHNAGGDVADYCTYRITGPWPLCAILGVGCWCYSYYLLRLAAAREEKDVEDEHTP